MAKTAGEALASNVRARRAAADLSQQALADAMRGLGHRWNRATVAAVEGGERTVNTDELLGLCLVLHAYVGELLDPGEDLSFGGPTPAPAALAAMWARSQVRLRWRDGQLGAQPTPAGLDAYVEWTQGRDATE